MATQRQASGGVVQRDGFAFGGLEQVGLFVRALNDGGVGEQGRGVDALLAGRRPQLPATVAREGLQRIGLRQGLQLARISMKSYRPR